MICKRCHRDKCEGEFYKGNRARCKECKKLDFKEWRTKNPDAYKIIRAIYAKTKKAKVSKDKYKQSHIEQIRSYNRTWYTKNRKKPIKKKIEVDWHKRNPDKVRAHQIVHNAVRYGRLTPSIECFICHRDSTRLSAHHTDYSKPLDVTWICGSCHRLVHKQKLTLAGTPRTVTPSYPSAGRLAPARGNLAVYTTSESVTPFSAHWLLAAKPTVSRQTQEEGG